MNFQNDILKALNNNVPAYLVKKDGYYKATLNNGEVNYKKIPDSDIPQNVREKLN